MAEKKPNSEKTDNDRLEELHRKVAEWEEWLGRMRESQEALEARVAEWGALVEEHEAYFAPLKARVLEAACPAPPAAPTKPCKWYVQEHHCCGHDKHVADCEGYMCDLWEPAPQAAVPQYAVWLYFKESDVRPEKCAVCGLPKNAHHERQEGRE